MKKFLVSMAAVLVMVSAADAGPIRDRIAQRRAERQERACNAKPVFPAVAQSPIVQAVGQTVKDAFQIIPAAYYSLPMTCPNGRCNR